MHQNHMCIFSLLNFLNNLLKTVLSYLERLPKCNAKKNSILILGSKGQGSVLGLGLRRSGFVGYLRNGCSYKVQILYTNAVQAAIACRSTKITRERGGCHGV